MDRREFLKNTGIISAGSFLLPSFLRADVFGNNGLSIKNKRVVFVQLSGGNDGLNTIVPYGLDEYYQNRSNIGLKAEELLKIDDKFAFNPVLQGLKEMTDKGMLSIINSVGYPNPNRSHFRSMDIWHTASDAEEYLSYGWLGRYLDSNCQFPYEAIEINGKLALALKGQERSGIALTNPKTFYESINAPFFETLKTPKSQNKELDFMYKVFNETRDASKYIFEKYKLKTNKTVYGGSNFGQSLKEIATLIKADIRTPVFYTEIPGFDTHINQVGNQNYRLRWLNDGLTSFVNDLTESGLMQDTTIVVFSEFGRRLKENASRGTDHGAANVLFVIDSNLSEKAHLYNQIDLQDLNDGDPIFQVDFRSVYQEILTHTLKVDAEIVLGRTYTPLHLFT